MPDPPARPPVTALRITRPYASEDEFLSGDLAFIGRGTLTLPGAPVRPGGSLVRFEIVLSSGAAALRGEGTVIGHHGPASGKPPGLELKLTRLDARSKALLDRARSLRSQPGGLMSAAPPAPPSLAPRSKPPSAPAGSPPRAASTRPASPAAPAAPAVPAVPGDRTTETSGVRPSVPARAPVPGFTRPANRDEILARLRERAVRLGHRVAFGKPSGSE